MEQAFIEKYARLVVSIGVNLQKGQTLIISSPIECAPFTRCITHEAYRAGAKNVVMNWEDERTEQLKFTEAPEEVFGEFPAWQKQFYHEYLQMGAAFLKIAAPDPDLMKEVDPSRLGLYYRTMAAALAEYQQRLSGSLNAWSVAAVPTVKWAQKVFPDCGEAEAVEKLWQAIAVCVHLDEDDPVKAWEKHLAQMKKRTEYLNQQRFCSLRYRNSLGTDLTIRLLEKHLWCSGGEHLPNGTEFLPNIPTEEIFTVPEKGGANGVIYSSKPMAAKGSGVVENFRLTVKDGRIVEYAAETGLDTLRELIESDAGSHYLGEVALVSYDSPIARTGVLFWNTLFDENAACHLAIGNALQFCLEGSEKMTEQELEKIGFNLSGIHQDFMIGTRDMEITGVTADGRELPLMREGQLVF